MLLAPVLEECPKWHALKEVLEEIESYNSQPEGAGPETDEKLGMGRGRVLVAAADDRTCNQLKEVSQITRPVAQSLTVLSPSDLY